ncbi:MAG: glycoside hydrolase family 3 protein [Clostridia bacterium]|nr:glycoside hydrolase family 3 protein [Clostridia bacterium]
MRELKFEELSVKQKIGMVTCGLIPSMNRTPERDEYVLDLIRNHALGAVWVNPKTPDLEGIMAKIKEAADYPILIITDAESGLDPYTIGKHNALGMADSEELAYQFGKVTAVTARKLGYNVVCNPILDSTKGARICGVTIRSLGSDTERITAIGKAMAKGMHDGGVLTVGKHYPSAIKITNEKGRYIDSHMAETTSELTEEQLVEQCLYPYLELMKEGLLDGIMTGHCRLPNIDPDYPASLSKKIIGIIREKGFDGFIITDALSMMGVVAKFGFVDSKGLSVENGNDSALVWTSDNKVGMDAMYECYEKGIISDERLDEATKVILNMQHRVLEMNPKYKELTKEDEELFDKINTDSIFAKTDDGLPTNLSKDGKHYFVVLTGNETDINDDGKVEVDTFNGGWHGGWYNPKAIMERIAKDFPNSDSTAIREYPTGWNVQCVLEKATEFDDVVLITYQDAAAYIGYEALTSRIISMVDALQVTNKVSTVIHFGNPCILEDLVHIPRIIVGCCAAKSIDAAFDVVTGKYPAKGKLTYDVNFA